MATEYRTRRLPGLTDVPPSSGGLISAMKAAISSPQVSTVTPRQTLENAATTQVQRETMVGGARTYLPINYGYTQVGAIIVAKPVIVGQTLHLIAAWSEGEIQGIYKLYFDDTEITASTAGVTYTHYTGTAGQTCPAGMTAAWSSYTDALPNVAYTYITISSSANFKGLPNIKGLGYWLKIYDPRTETTVYSNNPALELADLITDTTYGRGMTVNWDSVGDAADRWDEYIGTRKRRTCNISLRNRQLISQYIDVLRAYAGVMLYPDGDEIFFALNNSPRDIDHTLTADHLKDFRVQLKGENERPDNVTVWYDDPDNKFARTPVYSQADSYIMPPFEYSMEGLGNADGAQRYAVEMLNRGTLIGRTANATLADHSGLIITPGDRVNVTWGNVSTGDDWRVTGVNRGQDHVWTFTCEDYNALTASDDIADPVTYEDPSIPNPLDPPTPTGLTTSESTKLLASDVYATALVISWDDVNETWPYVGGYIISVTGGGRTWTRSDIPATNTSVTTETLIEETTYLVSVRVTSDVKSSIVSDAVTTTVTIQGNNKYPANVTGFTRAQEMGGTVYLWWPKANGATRGYHIKYGTTSDTWATATNLETTIQATSYKDNGFPEGTYKFFIKGIGPTGLESPVAAYATVEVKSDTQYLFLGDKLWDSTELTLTKFAPYWQGADYYVWTDNGETWNTGYTGTEWDSDSLGNVELGLPRNTYGGSDGLNDTITIETDSWQFATTPVSGQFSVSGIEATLLENGDTANYKIEIGLSDNDSDWTWNEGVNITGGGAYAKVRITDLSDGVNAGLIFRLAISMTVVATTRIEKHLVELDATQPYAFSYDYTYSAIKSVTANAINCGARAFADADNVTTSGCDLYITQYSDGAAIAGTVSLIVEGI